MFHFFNHNIFEYILCEFLFRELMVRLLFKMIQLSATGEYSITTREKYFPGRPNSGNKRSKCKY
jgi:hypothetical protein